MTETTEGLAPVWFHTCNGCGRYREIDISPEAVEANHRNQRAEEVGRSTAAQIAANPANRQEAMALERELLAGDDPYPAHVFFVSCSSCGRSRAIDISPLKVAENHAVRATDLDHQAHVRHITGPATAFERQVAMSEQIDAAAEKAYARERASAAEAAADRDAWARYLATGDRAELGGGLHG